MTCSRCCGWLKHGPLQRAVQNLCRDRTRLISEICQGVFFLHNKIGVTHRDLKPANILLNAMGEVRGAVRRVRGPLLTQRLRSRSATWECRASWTTRCRPPPPWPAAWVSGAGWRCWRGAERARGQARWAGARPRPSRRRALLAAASLRPPTSSPSASSRTSCCRAASTRLETRISGELSWPVVVVVVVVVVDD